jgi:hypothetical protein
MDTLSSALYIAAYLFAVIDGTWQRRALLPEDDPRRTGMGLYTREHPWIVAGAACGVLGVVADVLAA